MTSETFDLGECLRLMQDPDLGAGVVALIASMHANDTKHPAHTPIPVIPFALELAESPERATAALLHLGALVVAALGIKENDVDAVLQRWALL